VLLSDRVCELEGARAHRGGARARVRRALFVKTSAVCNNSNAERPGRRRSLRGAADSVVVLRHGRGRLEGSQGGLVPRQWPLPRQRFELPKGLRFLCTGKWGQTVA